MSVIRWNHGWCTGIAACGTFLALVLPVQADSQHDFPELGTVISVAIDRGHVYTIETGDKVYQMLCMMKAFQFTPPQCKIAGNPIIVNDTVHFRRDGDVAYLSDGGNGEEKLLILSTELKVLSPLPLSSGLAAGERGAVLGIGMQLDRSRHSAAPNNDTPSGPVIAIPVTGGPPVQVIPAAPPNGGVVTGTPVTGGAPVTAIPVTPMSSPARSASAWIHFVRLQTAGRVYDLACPSKSCSLKKGPIQLGDQLAIRVQKKFAYLSLPVPGPTSEQKFEILAVRSIDDPPGIPAH
jgi:hypothetical protein